MNVISKEFHFSASHILHGLKDGHPCGRLHGHNYILKFHLKGEPNEIGFVQDYNELDPLGVAVSLKAQHLCMSMRGVKKHQAVTKTTALYGVFKSDDKARNEFING